MIDWERDAPDMTASPWREIGLAKLEALRTRRPLPLYEALRLLAIHRLPPPPWLAEAMLARLPRDRANAVELDAVIELAELAAAMGLPQDEVAYQLGMSEAKLKRWLRRYREFIEQGDF